MSKRRMREFPKLQRAHTPPPQAFTVCYCGDRCATFTLAVLNELPVLPRVSATTVQEYCTDTSGASSRTSTHAARERWRDT